MPCWEINTMELDLNIKQKELIEAALAKLGINYRELTWDRGDRIMDFTLARNSEYLQMGINLTTGKFIFGSDSQTLVDKANEIRREIATEAVREMAKRKRWVLRKTGANAFRARRY